MGHVVLLGDSIFDNDTYVEPEPAVIGQLRHEQRPLFGATYVYCPTHVQRLHFP